MGFPDFWHFTRISLVCMRGDHAKTMAAIMEGVTPIVDLDTGILTDIVVLDTNIVLDFLTGRAPAGLLFRSYKQKATTMMISVVTVIEVLVGIVDLTRRKKVGLWLESFQPVSVGSDIASAAALLRQQFKLKVPDAVIMATAQYYGGILVTRDRDFSRIPGVHYPYTLS